MLPSRDGRAPRRPGAERPRASSLPGAARAALLLLAGLAPAACGTTLPPLPAFPAEVVRSSLPPAPPGGYDTGAPYPLLPGDRISITVRDNPDLNVDLPIPSDGVIEVWKSEREEGGARETVRAQGMTVAGLADSLAEVYQRTRFKFRPFVQVALVEAVPRTVFVRGAVRSATGVVDLPRTGGRMTLWRAIQAAGGALEDADLSRVRISRKDPASGSEVSLPVYDLVEMLERAAYDRDPPLEPGDIVTVPLLGKVWIAGQVHNPGSYFCRRDLSLLSLVAEAGGLKQFAKRGDIRVVRGLGTSGERTYSVDYDDILDGRAPDPRLAPGDRISVAEDWK